MSVFIDVIFYIKIKPNCQKIELIFIGIIYPTSQPKTCRAQIKKICRGFATVLSICEKSNKNRQLWKILQGAFASEISFIFHLRASFCTSTPMQTTRQPLSHYGISPWSTCQRTRRRMHTRCRLQLGAARWPVVEIRTVGITETIKTFLLIFITETIKTLKIFKIEHQFCRGQLLQRPPAKFIRHRAHQSHAPNQQTA